VVREVLFTVLVGVLVLGGLWSSTDRGSPGNSIFAGVGFGILFSRAYVDGREQLRRWKASEAYRTGSRPLDEVRGLRPMRPVQTARELPPENPFTRNNLIWAVIAFVAFEAILLVLNNPMSWGERGRWTLAWVALQALGASRAWYRLRKWRAGH
jgi:hypothetical protein